MLSCDLYGEQQGLQFMLITDYYWSMITMPKLCDQSRIGVESDSLYLGGMKWDKSKLHTS